MYTFMVVHYPFLIIACFIPSQALMLTFEHFSGLPGSMVFKVCKSSHLCFSNPHCEIPLFGKLYFHFSKCLTRQLYSTIDDITIVFIP